MTVLLLFTLTLLLFTNSNVLQYQHSRLFIYELSLTFVYMCVLGPVCRGGVYRGAVWGGAVCGKLRGGSCVCVRNCVRAVYEEELWGELWCVCVCV